MTLQNKDGNSFLSSDMMIIRAEGTNKICKEIGEQIILKYRISNFYETEAGLHK